MTSDLDRHQPRLVHYKVFSPFLGLYGLDVTPGKALAVLRNFEERTGQNPNPLLLKPEEFAKLLEPEEYNITPELESGPLHSILFLISFQKRAAFTKKHVEALKSALELPSKDLQPLLDEVTSIHEGT